MLCNGKTDQLSITEISAGLPVFANSGNLKNIFWNLGQRHVVTTPGFVLQTWFGSWIITHDFRFCCLICDAFFLFVHKTIYTNRCNRNTHRYICFYGTFKFHTYIQFSSDYLLRCLVTCIETFSNRKNMRKNVDTFNKQLPIEDRGRITFYVNKIKLPCLLNNFR